MVIFVDECDIQEGKIGDSTECPIALATNRAFDISFTYDLSGFISGSVVQYIHTFKSDRNEIRVYKNKVMIARLDLSESMMNFIDRFDRGEDVRPQSFHVEDVRENR